MTVGLILIDELNLVQAGIDSVTRGLQEIQFTSCVRENRGGLASRHGRM